MRLENTWQEIRDHSFIQNLSRSFRFTASMLVLLLFNSPHSFSTGFRSEDWNGHSRSFVLFYRFTRHCVAMTHWECPLDVPIVWSPYKITPIHSISGLFLVTHFCVIFEVCIWIIVRLEDPNMAHYNISNRVCHLLICICWYLIESMIPCV